MKTWAHLRHGEQVRQHDMIAGDGLPATGDGLPVTGLAVYEKEYWKREIAKVAAQIDAKNARLEAAKRAAEVQADKMARAADAKADEGRAKGEKIDAKNARLETLDPAEDYAQVLGPLLSAASASASVERTADGNVLVIHTPRGECDHAALESFQKGMVAMKYAPADAGFVRMRCDPDSAVLLLQRK